MARAVATSRCSERGGCLTAPGDGQNPGSAQGFPFGPRPWVPPSGGIVGWPGVCYNGPQHHGAKFSSQPTGCSGPSRALC
jgi:hypothetical protein